MAFKIDGVDKRIGLALSGGGFRAAAFHLGVMRKLQALNLLDKLDLVSCVSGGSIAGATLAANWGDPSCLDKLETYLRTRSIAVASVVGGLLDPFESRLEKLAGSYDRDLFHDKTLSSLQGGPRIYFNATNLATGNMFFFVAGGGKDAEMGEHELGVVPAAGFPISRAVAASSAFPPVFPPLLLPASVYPPAAATVEYVTLTDGGVYDNMGVNPLLRMARNPIDYLIVSDGGKPFAFEERPTESGAVVLKASLDIMMEQIRGLQFDRLQHRHLAGKGARPLWFSIDSIEGEQQQGDASFASAISTNLKKLNDDEMRVLVRHGGALLGSRIGKYAPELATVAP
ncbi:patatin-like phospholipase family protein [Variovorax saccharolyticus]|uniref:patatin-like phospholipase family protein n=1 Tax=Variovorax saccharolyticus TaxID=3053516 RepID=UPI002577A916|nr:patatin-like phospholipase family protein [Variovorax sp. J22R187]MDM0019426.1 patatin-like phospholipase family protein [Variovorax sp. J22R187]